jgi:hypothetical protein
MCRHRSRQSTGRRLSCSVPETPSIWQALRRPSTPRGVGPSEDARRGSLLHAPSGRPRVGNEWVDLAALFGEGPGPVEAHRPTTVRRGLARRGHVEWPGGHPSDKERQVPCSSELETMLHLARGAPRRGNASRPRPTDEVERPSARDRQSLGRARAGDTRDRRRASRRVGESTAGGLVPMLVDPGSTSAALRRGHRGAGPDDTLRDSRGLRAGVVDGAGTQERGPDLWERLTPFGE